MDELFSNNKEAVVSSNRILHTPSSFARSSLLHLQEIGELKALREHVSKRAGLQSFLFFFVVEGEGQLTYDGEEFTLTKDSCVFINCQKPYSHTTSPDHLWSLRWVHFYGPTMSSIYNKYCERGGRAVFTPKTMEPIYSSWNSIMSVTQGRDYMKDMMINQDLATLLTLIMSESWHPEDRATAPKRQSVSAVASYLDENYAEPFSLEELSSRFFIDKFYLAKCFKEQYGQTISTYLTNVRITKAKQLLRFTDKTVEEIGYEVGLSSPAYFSRVFKEVEGVSPKVFRAQW